MLSGWSGTVNTVKNGVSKLFRNVPFVTSLEVSPFWFLFFVVGLARSAALRSPEGVAFRAKRRARPTTVAPRALACWLVVALLGGPPLATGGCWAAPISAAAALVR